jgi:AcrR family transcriptional regulator
VTPPAEPAAPTLRRDALANRDRILAAAVDAFAEEGLGVSLVEIARRAGVGNATVHRNFTKEGLLDALFDEWFARRRSAAEEALKDPDPWHGLTSYLEDVLRDASRNRALAELVAIRLRQRQKAVPQFARLVQRAHESGALRTDVTPEDIFLVVLGVGRTLQVTGESSPDQWRRHLAIALDGLRARVGQSPLPCKPISARQLDVAFSSWAGALLGGPRGN